jgi:hypothetical protein
MKFPHTHAHTPPNKSHTVLSKFCFIKIEKVEIHVGLEVENMLKKVLVK